MIFSVYENDPKAVCDALEDMGILRRGADRVSGKKKLTTTLAHHTQTTWETEEGQ